jgi:hypothetical protein
MLGEIHGTREAPDFLGRAVCSIASTRRPVVLALEYPRDQQRSIDAFLGNSNTFWAEANLLRTPFWNESAGDGTSSEALLKLLLNVRSWRRDKLPIKVVAYDIPAHASAGVDREASNAAFLAELLRRQIKDAFTIIYSGNVHTRKTKGLSGNDSFEPLGFRLRQWDMLHLDMATTGGSAWNCSGPIGDDCGPRSLRANFSITLKPYSVRLDPALSAYDGVYFVGRATESPPARRLALAPDPLPNPDVEER